MALSQAEPKPGDLIEILHVGYQHWALYVGDGYVVHLPAPDGVTGPGADSFMLVRSEKTRVKKELLSVVAGNDQYRVNNKHDQKRSVRPPNEIRGLALSLVGQERLYNVTSANCEHFVIELRYRVPSSDQFTFSFRPTGMRVLGTVLGLAAGVVGSGRTIGNLIGALWK